MINAERFRWRYAEIRRFMEAGKSTLQECRKKVEELCSTAKKKWSRTSPEPSTGSGGGEAVGAAPAAPLVEACEQQLCTDSEALGARIFPPQMFLLCSRPTQTAASHIKKRPEGT